MLNTKLTAVTPKKNYSNKIVPYHQVENFDSTYTARFSVLFQPFEHNYTPGFDVLKLAYWLKYGILEYFDVSIYELIYFFCKTKTPFSLEILAERLKVGNTTLRQSLDNLENAELLEVVSIIDEYGKHNSYILKTPYFERESIDYTRAKTPAQDKAARAKRARFATAEKPLPTEFLDDHAGRLLRQVRKNHVGKRRRMIADRKQKIACKYPDYLAALREESSDRSLLWKQVSRTLPEHAASFNEFIYQQTPDIAAEPTNAGRWSKIREKVKSFCESFALKYDDVWFPEIGRKLFEFFRRRLRLPDVSAPPSAQPQPTDDQPETTDQTGEGTPTATPPVSTVSNADERERAEKTKRQKDRERAAVRAYIADKHKKGVNLADFGTLRRVYNGFYSQFLIDDEKIAEFRSYFTGDEWQKLCARLRE